MRDRGVTRMRVLSGAARRWQFQMHNRMWSDNNVYGGCFARNNHLTPGVRHQLCSILPCSAATQNGGKYKFIVEPPSKLVIAPCPGPRS